MQRQLGNNQPGMYSCIPSICKLVIFLTALKQDALPTPCNYLPKAQPGYPILWWLL